MKAFFLFALFAVSTANSDFYLCEYVVPNFCANPPSGIANARDSTQCMDEPSLNLQNAAYTLSNNFNVISFGGFNAGTQDTEGRVAVRNSGSLGRGYSIGALIYSRGVGATDAVLPYSAIFGGDLTWQTGELYPVYGEAGTPYADTTAAYTEYLYVGGKLNTDGSDSGLGRRLGSKLEASGSFNTQFDNAQSYYTQVQQYLNGFPNNVDISVSYGSATVTCTTGTSADNYYAHINAADLSTITSWTFDSSCSASVQMVITVQGSGDAIFQSNGFTAAQRDASRTVFNMLNTGAVVMQYINFAGILLAPNSEYKNGQSSSNVVEGVIIVGDVQSSGQFNRVNCSRPVVPAQPRPCVGFESVCTGTTFTAPGASAQSDTRDFNLISFGSFVANTGDIEGRAMVRDDFTVGNGFSIGYMVASANDLTDQYEQYALLAGGKCTWGSGALYPDGSNVPFAADEEFIYCGDTFSGPSELAARTSGPCASAGCLDSIFDAAETCYNSYASTLAAVSDSVTTSVSFNALTITCTDNTADAYSFTIDAAELPQFTYYVTENCNYQAQWTINIVGTEDVYFSGDSFPAPSGSVVYNVQGCDRTIFVTGTALNGHLLAPCATLNQTGGVILGKVVVGDVAMSLQINKETYCQTLTNTSVPVPSGPTPTQPGNDTICPNAPINVLIAGYSVSGPSVKPGTKITSFDADTNCGTVSPPIAAYVAANSRAFVVQYPSNGGGGQPYNAPNNNSAATVAFSVALFVAALLF